jgi:uracil-DNA glycosylase
MGLCFSVPKGIKVPPSLSNIYKNLASKVPGFKIPKHGDLTKWANQGL